MEEFLASHNILIGVFGSIILFWLTRMDKKFEKIDTRFDKIDAELREIRKDIQGLDSRISRLEGPLWMTCSSLNAARLNENYQKEAQKQ